MKNAFILNCTRTPRGDPSGPLRVQRNREIINIMMLPAKMTEIITHVLRKSFLGIFCASYTINAKNTILQKHDSIRQMSQKVDVKCSFVA